MSWRGAIGGGAFINEYYKYQSLVFHSANYSKWSSSFMINYYGSYGFRAHISNYARWHEYRFRAYNVCPCILLNTAAGLTRSRVMVALAKLYGPTCGRENMCMSPALSSMSSSFHCFLFFASAMLAFSIFIVPSISRTLSNVASKIC